MYLAKNLEDAVNAAAQQSRPFCAYLHSANAVGGLAKRNLSIN